jgi:acetyl esterase/lipase
MVRRFALVAAFVLTAVASAQERIRDVIYAKSAGSAFTMDVFKPKTPNGAAVIWLISGGWFSSHDQINPQAAELLNSQGYTVFEVVHGSQPRFTIPDIAKQIRRAVRFVHANASTYGIDGDRIGITGSSAGGHLSLLAAGTADAGDANASDPIERAPSTVAAVVAFFPPTDFLNYGAAGNTPVDSPQFAIFKPAFGIKPNATPEEIAQIARIESPIYTISPSFPPTLLVHGDADTLVPIQQSESFRDALKKAGVATDLVVVKGGKHDGATLAQGITRALAWFNEKLRKK